MDRSQLAIANKFVRIDYASDAPIVSGPGACIRLVGSHDAASALNYNVILAPRHFGWQRNFKLYRRVDLQRGVGANVYASGAQVAGHSRVSVFFGIFSMNLDRQMQRKPFPGTRFGHKPSSALALRGSYRKNQTRAPQSRPTACRAANGVISRKIPPKEA